MLEIDGYNHTLYNKKYKINSVKNFTLRIKGRGRKDDR